MNLFQNPFYILGVSARATSQEIYEAYDKLILSKDPELCRNARTILTHPRKRLAAEIAWLPGVSPSKAIDLIDKIVSDWKHVIDSFSTLPPLSRCNLIASFLIHKTPSNLDEWIHYIAKTFDSVDSDRVMRMINEDRTVASVALIQDLSQIENELQNHFNFLVGAMRDCLDRLPDPDIIFTKVVEKATLDGSEQAPILIDDLADRYQVEVQKYLDQLSEKIITVCTSIKDQGNLKTHIDRYLDTIEETLHTWDQIAQPIQLIMQSRGREDENSLALAEALRNLALHLANEYDLHEEAIRILYLMSEVFKDLPEFHEMVQGDLSTLEGIVEEKKKALADHEKWKKDISLDIHIRKDHLSISPEFVSYRGISIKTDEISRVRWGVYKQYVNAIRVVRRYTIWVGSPKGMLEIECARALESEDRVRQRYDVILDKVWKAVCVRLISETLSRLSSGEKIWFGEVVADKNGLLLQKRKFFKKKPFYSRWEDLTISNGRGTFIITSSKEKNACGELAYRDVDNVHILEAIMGFLWKDGNYARLQKGELS